jgi:hypothetical protein
MPKGVNDRRALELAIRAAEAEERVLARRLERLAADHLRTRRLIERERGADDVGRLSDGSPPDDAA